MIEYTKVHQVLKGARSWPWFLIGIIAMVIMFIYIVRQRYTFTQTMQQYDITVRALRDTLRTSRDESGAQKATISAFSFQKRKDFLKIKTQDSTIKRLQDVVSTYGKKMGQGAAAVFTSNTTINNTSKTQVVARDTVRKDSLVYLFPEYRSNFKLGKWISGVTVSNKDSTTVNIRTYNEYDVVVGEGNRGWFRKSQPFADVITHSPYDSISRLRALNVTAPPKKRLGLGFQAGYGYTLELKPERVIYVGVGVSYNVIRIK